MITSKDKKIIEKYNLERELFDNIVYPTEGINEDNKKMIRLSNKNVAIIQSLIKDLKKQIETYHFLKLLMLYWIMN